MCAPATALERRAEQYVSEQIHAGKAATRKQYLKEIQSSTSDDFALRGCFLSSLLGGASGVPQTGLTIEGARIDGPVDVRNKDINFHVELIDCTFTDDFNMKRSHFSKGLSFKGSRFGSKVDGPGRLDAEDATVDFDFTLDDCNFENCLTFLKSMRIGVDMSMRHAKFHHPVDFTGTVIGSNLFADKENPKDPSEPATEFSSADFEGIKVGLDANLTEVTFHGPVSFNNASFNNLGLEHSTFEGDASFKSTQITDFYLGDNPAGRFEGNLMIEDLAFQYMSPEDLDQLKDFAEKSNSTRQQAQYNTQLYTTLETILRKHGHNDWGDEVYIAGKRKERQYDHWYWRAWSYFLDAFIGYGRHIERLLWWSLIFITLGCIAFWSRTDMERKKPEDNEEWAKRYCPFLYTLDLFLPIIQLGYTEIWTPKRTWARFYKPVHVIVGHLFVPIGLAAWTGIIK